VIIEDCFNKITNYFVNPELSLVFPTNINSAANYNSIIGMAGSAEKVDIIWNAMSQRFRKRFEQDQAYNADSFEMLLHIFHTNSLNYNLKAIEAKEFPKTVWDKVAVTSFERDIALFDVIKP